MQSANYIEYQNGTLQGLDKLVWDKVNLCPPENSSLHIIHEATGKSTDNLTWIEAWKFIWFNSYKWNLKPELRHPRRFLEFAKNVLDNTPSLSDAQCPEYIEIKQTTNHDWPYNKTYKPMQKERLFGEATIPATIPLYSERLTHESQNDLNADVHHFWNMLVALMPRSGLETSEEQTVRILDVGCSQASSALPLRGYFSNDDRFTKQTSVGVEYLGIDISKEGIDWAKKTWVDTLGFDHLSFQTADATNFDRYESLRGQFDVIVIRHQESGDDYETWEKIFHESAKHVRPGGILLFTSYVCAEHRMAEMAMTSTGLENVISGKNPFSGKTNWYCDGEEANCNENYWYRDRYVAIYKKTTPSDY